MHREKELQTITSLKPTLSHSVTSLTQRDQMHLPQISSPLHSHQSHSENPSPSSLPQSTTSPFMVIQSPVSNSYPSSSPNHSTPGTSPMCIFGSSSSSSSSQIVPPSPQPVPLSSPHQMPVPSLFVSYPQEIFSGFSNLYPASAPSTGIYPSLYPSALPSLALSSCSVLPLSSFYYLSGTTDPHTDIYHQLNLSPRHIIQHPGYHITGAEEALELSSYFPPVTSLEDVAFSPSAACVNPFSASLNPFAARLGFMYENYPADLSFLQQHRLPFPLHLDVNR